MAPSKSFPYTDKQLKEAGLLGEGEVLCRSKSYPTLTTSLIGVSDSVKEALEMMRKRPDLLEPSLFALQCLNSADQRNSSSPASPTPSQAASSRLSAADSTAVTQHIVSEWERTTYYHGVSSDPPELLYRSDFFENPYPIPEGRHSQLPSKTIIGVFGTPLNAVWGTVGPQIRQILKDQNIRYSSINTARFVSEDEDGNSITGPIVIWISTYPGSTTPENARDACPDILAVLKANGVEGAVVEWYEAVVERL
ncbi:hypothetical protein EVG20_g935 [Dentipellis fragilis]|uniref:Uncharacterized protein n=1 Tax=Dentipellis fragilis TaxID=205917 RepID=A0A4Y9ZDZ3_9AGAM|nr:hypothetical protein EVG20_g935 [Dentipellis fragilis]